MFVNPGSGGWKLELPGLINEENALDQPAPARPPIVIQSGPRRPIEVQGKKKQAQVADAITGEAIAPTDAERAAFRAEMGLPGTPYENPGAMMPFGAGAGFTPTIAAARQSPQTYRRAADLPNGGTFVQVGDKYARDGDLERLAAAGDVGATLKLLQRGREDAQRLANATPVGGGLVSAAFSPEQNAATIQGTLGRQQGMAHQYQKEADQAVLRALGLSNDAFNADTQRAQAGVAEYGAKVTDPMRAVAQLAQEQMRGQTDLKKAELARRGMNSKLMMDEIAALKEKLGGYTKEDVKAIQDRYRAMDQEFKGGVGDAAGYEGPDYAGAMGQTLGMGVPGQRPPISIQSGPKAPITIQGPKEPIKLEDALTAGNQSVNTQEFVNKATGKGPDGKGGVTPGKFDPEQIAKAMVSYGGSLTDEQVRLLADTIKRGGHGDEEKIINALSRSYVRLSRRAGKPEGAGSLKIKQGDRGATSSGLELQSPAGGVIRGREAGGYIHEGWSALSQLLGAGAGAVGGGLLGATAGPAGIGVGVGAGGGAGYGIGQKIGNLPWWYTGTSDLGTTSGAEAQGEARKQAEAVERFLNQYLPAAPRR